MSFMTVSACRDVHLVTVRKDIIKSISDIYAKWAVGFPLFPEPVTLGECIQTRTQRNSVSQCRLGYGTVTSNRPCNNRSFLTDTELLVHGHWQEVHSLLTLFKYSGSYVLHPPESHWWKWQDKDGAGDSQTGNELLQA